MEKYSSILGEFESQVRSYCRKFPVEFSKARNSELFTKDGSRFIDFLDVAGSMNYGHNNPYIKKAIIDYLVDDSIINALDLYTDAKAAFLTTLERYNGRTGYFFSFERAGIVPDMVVLSKSISGFGMSMALLLMKPDLDIFRPAEHNGTFRGNQLAFVGGKARIEFFNENHIGEEVQRKAKIIDNFMRNEILPIDSRLS